MEEKRNIVGKRKNTKRFNPFYYELILHSIIWTFTLVILLWNFNLDNAVSRKIFVISTIPYIILFFLNYFVLLPRLLTKRKFFKYFIYTTILIVLLFIVIMPQVFISIKDKYLRQLNSANYYYEQAFEAKDDPQDTIVRLMDKPMALQFSKRKYYANVYNNIMEGRTPFSFNDSRLQAVNMALMAYLILGFSSTIRYCFKTQTDQIKIDELQKQKLTTELQYLRLQINPHFFMNTLNNIHALIDIDEEVAKETIIELSKIMRYVLYDCSHQWVPLSNGVLFMNSYIDIMKLRYSDNVKITKHFPDSEEGAFIIPLVFAPFIENAFKHGADVSEPSFIDIGYNLTSQNVTFWVTNSVHKIDKSLRELGQYSHYGMGIGLENVKKRLDLLFKDRYKIETNKTDKEYRMSVTMPIAQETSPGIFKVQ